MNSNFITWISLAIVFLVLVCCEYAGFAKRSRNLHDIIEKNGRPIFLNLKQLIGILFCTMVILHAYYNYHELLPPIEFPVNVAWALPAVILSVLSFGTGFFTREEIKNENNNGPANLSIAFLAPYFILRSIFLFVYEIYFRCLVLFITWHEFNLAIAIIVQSMLYLAAHYYSSSREQKATIPFGLLLCFLTIHYHSPWPAICIHWMLAMGHECRALLNEHSTIKTSEL